MARVIAIQIGPHRGVADFLSSRFDPGLLNLRSLCIFIDSLKFFVTEGAVLGRGRAFIALRIYGVQEQSVEEDYCNIATESL